jgi:hypothetical protein
MGYAKAPRRPRGYRNPIPPAITLGSYVSKFLKDDKPKRKGNPKLIKTPKCYYCNNTSEWYGHNEGNRGAKKFMCTNHYDGIGKAQLLVTDTRRDSPNYGMTKVNPSNIDTSSAEEMSQKFHGREPKEVLEVTEFEEYDPALTVLGDLVEIVVDSGKKELVIHFPRGEDRPKLCCDADGENLEIVGGDQSLEIEGLPSHKGKAPLGYATTICYETDKHHLEDSEGEVVEYQHKFGEEGGELPMVVYDVRNDKLELVGGDYTIEDVGIKD